VIVQVDRRVVRLDAEAELCVPSAGLLEQQAEQLAPSPGRDGSDYRDRQIRLSASTKP
jgi:hypothetical protein